MRGGMVVYIFGLACDRDTSLVKQLENVNLKFIQLLTGENS